MSIEDKAPEFAQSASNPQKAWAYPDEALKEFRRWFRVVYLPTKYPAYILRKAKVLSDDTVKQLAAMYEPKKIGKN